VRFKLTIIEERNNIINWDQNIERFNGFCQLNLQLAKNTCSKYAGDLKRFFKFIKGRGSSDCNDLVREFLKSVPNNGNSLRSLKAYFKFINREDVVKSYKFPRWQRRIKFVSKVDVQVFYYALRDVREKALFLFYATTGLRKNEVLSLRKEDVNRRLRMVIPKNH